MEILEGLKDVVDNVVLRGIHEKHVSIIGFSKCENTKEFIYKNELITLCGNCQACTDYKETLQKYLKTN